jgi:hypothetical protein
MEMTEQLRDSKDREHLRLLEIFHYICGTISCLWGFVGLLYVQLGVVMSRTFTGTPQNQSFSHMFAGLWIGMSIFSVVMFETGGVLSLLAGWKYRKRRSYWFCFVVAIFNCLLVPVGTALGAFSIFVLNRPSVKELFHRQITSDAG